MAGKTKADLEYQTWQQECLIREFVVAAGWAAADLERLNATRSFQGSPWPDKAAEFSRDKLTTLIARVEGEKGAVR
jgi:hypothetical protein